MARYKVLGGPNADIGVNFGDVRAEPGETIDIPDASDVRWLIDDGTLEPVAIERKPKGELSTEKVN